MVSQYICYKEIVLWTNCGMQTLYDGRLWTNCICGHFVMAACGHNVMWTFCSMWTIRGHLLRGILVKSALALGNFPDEVPLVRGILVKSDPCCQVNPRM